MIDLKLTQAQYDILKRIEAGEVLMYQNRRWSIRGKTVSRPSLNALKNKGLIKRYGAMYSIVHNNYFHITDIGILMIKEYEAANETT